MQAASLPPLLRQSDVGPCWNDLMPPTFNTRSRPGPSDLFRPDYIKGYYGCHGTGTTPQPRVESSLQNSGADGLSLITLLRCPQTSLTSCSSPPAKSLFSASKKTPMRR